MKAILEFDLSDPEDRMEHLRCIKSFNMSLAIWDIINKIKYKYREESTIPIEDLQYDIHSILDEYNINIEEITG